MEFRTEKAMVNDKHVLQYPRAVDVVHDLKMLALKMPAGNDPAQDPAQDPALMGWAMTQAFQLVSSTRNIDDAITTATVKWPDGATGVFTSTELSTEFPGAIDAYTVTYEKGDISYTLTQPAVTRNASGAVTAQPDIIITKN